MYYVYVYLDPTTELPFYVGKGTGKRLHQHCQYYYLKNPQTPFHKKAKSDD